MGKKSGSGSGMNHPDHISKSVETNFFGLKYLNSLMGGSGIQDGKNSDPGSGLNIPDPQHCTLVSKKILPRSR
jgi:hypothetical protein